MKKWVEASTVQGMSGQVSTASNGWAIASLVIAVISAVIVLVGIPYGVIGGIIALFAGLDGINQARKLGGSGLGLAIAGTIIGGIITLTLIWFLVR